MRKIFNIPVLFAVLALTLVSCKSELKTIALVKDFELDKNNLIKEAQITEKMAENAELFRKSVSSKCAECGVYINDDVVKIYEDRPKVLAARCILLGITDAYIYVKYDQMGTHDYSTMLRNLVKGLHLAGVKVQAVIVDPAIYSFKTDLVSKYIQKIEDFNAKYDADTKFDGVSIDIQPDNFVRNSELYNYGVLYRWANDNYGKGGDNDLLMKQCLGILEKAKKNLAGMTLAQTISHYYDTEVAKGTLTCGKVDEFLKYADTVRVIANSSDKRDIWEYASQVLLKAERGQSVVVSVKTSKSIHGDKVRDTSLSWKSWGKIVKDLEFIVDMGGKHASFRGLAFHDYEGLEKAWE